MTMYPQDTWLLGGLAWYEPPSMRAASRRHCSFAERLRPLELRGGGPFAGCTGGQTALRLAARHAVRLKKNDEVDGVGFAREPGLFGVFASKPGREALARAKVPGTRQGKVRALPRKVGRWPSKS